jgi:hypothetical protein
MIDRRQSLLRLMGCALLPLSGCATVPEPKLTRTSAVGSHCYKASKGRHLTCTSGPVPPLAVDTEAKRFAPDESAFTLYIVRQRWADALHRVDISVDDRPVGTVPESFIRARLRPGTHRLVLDWEGRRTELHVQGAAGELRFVELVGTSLAWGSRFEWAVGHSESSRSRATRCRLVADLALV